MDGAGLWSNGGCSVLEAQAHRSPHHLRTAFQVPVAVLQVTLASNAYVPVMVAVVAPPVVSVAACPARLIAHPFGADGMVAEIAPLLETVPENVSIEPENGATVPWTAPFASTSIIWPVAVAPFDWPPLQLPA